MRAPTCRHDGCGKPSEWAESDERGLPSANVWCAEHLPGGIPQWYAEEQAEAQAAATLAIVKRYCTLSLDSMTVPTREFAAEILAIINGSTDPTPEPEAEPGWCSVVDHPRWCGCS